jgi:hypothetical protein
MSQTTGISVTVPGAVYASYNAWWANGTNARGFSLGASDITANPQLGPDLRPKSGSALIDAGTCLNNVDHPPMPGPNVPPPDPYKCDIGAFKYNGYKYHLYLPATMSPSPGN